VTLSRQKRCRGTLQSSKCDADAPKYGARTFALLVSIQTRNSPNLRRWGEAGH